MATLKYLTNEIIQANYFDFFLNITFSLLMR